MNKISKFVIAHRKTVILLTLIITIFLGYFIKDLQVDPDILNYLPKSDPVVKLSEYIGEEYGGNLLAMVAMETTDLFTPSALKEMDLLSNSLERVEGVTSVTSLTNILDIKGDDGLIEIGTLVDLENLPVTVPEFQELKEYILGKNLYQGKLISADATTALLICQLQDHVDKVKISKAIKNEVEKLKLLSTGDQRYDY
jgi:hypothetical protein